MLWCKCRCMAQVSRGPRRLGRCLRDRRAQRHLHLHFCTTHLHLHLHLPLKTCTCTCTFHLPPLRLVHVNLRNTASALNTFTPTLGNLISILPSRRLVILPVPHSGFPVCSARVASAAACAIAAAGERELARTAPRARPGCPPPTFARRDVEGARACACRARRRAPRSPARRGSSLRDRQHLELPQPAARRGRARRTLARPAATCRSPRCRRASASSPPAHAPARSGRRTARTPRRPSRRSCPTARAPRASGARARRDRTCRRASAPPASAAPPRTPRRRRACDRTRGRARRA